MIDPELLSLLCCPETHQPLHPADAALVLKLNQSIAAGGVKTRAGKDVTEAVDSALLREDRQVLYAVRRNIPILLADEAIPLPA